MKIINLTPHTVNLMGGRDGPLEIPASGTVALAAELRNEAGSINGFPAFIVEHGEIVGLPEPAAGVLYLVSALAFDAAVKAGRRDVVAVTDFVRDKAGRIVGARALRVPG